MEILLQKQRSKIQKVLEMLREIDSNKKCNDLLVVSIGPYHHGEFKLQAVEKLKPLIAKQYVLDGEKPVDDLQKSCGGSWRCKELLCRGLD
ncbi:hypothetical protein O6P43_006410 [Quillaja saponaria]|uniref:Uncharacterized protein n=1 Tax=Quillaja saponaria TaxID=32244 RepID=A0AAD7VI85_QUISA|nr:hypothetical protein O6P43_006410 [Quillaja saponaria]